MDFFTIHLSNGYSASGNLTSGDLTVHLGSGCSGALRAPTSKFGGHRPPLQLFSDNCDVHASSVLGVPVFKKKNALPCAELHFSVDDRQRFACPG